MKLLNFYIILALVFVLSPVLLFAQDDDTGENRVCAADVKSCPDGSFVSRKAPSCDFMPCPGEDGEEDNDLWPSRTNKDSNYMKDDNAQDKDKEQEEESNDSESNDSTDDEMDDMDDNSATSTDDMDEEDDSSSREDRRPFSVKSEIRKSAVANAVQEMLRVASSTEATIGEQIREIAREQKEEHEEVEETLEKVAKRGGLARFFIGPDYSEIKKAEQYVEMYQERLQKMEEAVAEVTAQDLVDALETQIQELEEVKTELETEIEEQKGGFSLFGWLNRLFAQ